MSTPFNHTQTSRDRARYLDESGTGQERRQDIVASLHASIQYGLTSKEYAQQKGYDSLPTWVTGAFSALHQDGDIIRITERRPEGRGAAYVYVHPKYLDGRAVLPYKSNEGITQEDRDLFAWYDAQIESAKAEGKSLSQGFTDLQKVLRRLS